MNKQNRLLIIPFLFSSLLFAQSGNGTIRGEVHDKFEDIPMEYANVVLYSPDDLNQLNGTITDGDGLFVLKNVQPGNYKIAISFIGFKDYKDENILVTADKTLHLGVIELTPHSYNVEDVVVDAQRSMISYEIDKKVINVSEQITSASGSAVDVLENVPSVTVDIEGNVSLRGSGSFRVLVDGRPSILDPNEILEQIPASSIENIEIVTNPSAKYDPEGTAGFINLVMKKNKRAGLSGLAEFDGGLRNKYGSQGLFDYRENHYRISLGADYRDYISYSDRTDNNITTYEGNTSYRNSFGSSDGNRKHYGVKAEFEYNFTDMDIMSVGSRYRYRRSENDARVDFTEWSDIDPARIFYNSLTDRFRGGGQYEFFVNYEHKFAPKGHYIVVDFQFESDDGDEETVNKLFDNNQIVSGQKNTEYGPGTEIESKLDYTLELNKDSKFEAGYQNEIEIQEEKTGYYEYNTITGNYDYFYQFSNTTDYRNQEHAIYGLYASKLNNFGYQLGFRTELTKRKIELLRTGESFSIDRWDYFPSLHTSYKFTNEDQVMASYTRRIDRPRGYYLEPFETWTDAYNVRTGNPSLLPEYIDSYELGYQTLFGQSVFSIETYYRVNKNKIERIRSVYADNITLHTAANVGTDYSFGTELMYNFDPLKNWNINLMANYYNYRIRGTIDEETFERESNNWSLRFVNILKLRESTQFQLNGIYNSPSVSSQGEREGFYYINLALRHEFIKNYLSATLQIRDVLGTSDYEYISESKDYYSYYHRTREAPVVMLNLKFTFNKQSSDKDNRSDRPNGLGGGDDEFGQ